MSGAIYPQIPLYLERTFSIDEEGSSIIFFVFGFLYATTSPLAGFFSSRIGRKNVTMIGLAVSGFAWFIFAPLDLFDTFFGGTKVWRLAAVFVAFILIETGGALAFVPSLPMLIELGSNYGIEEQRLCGLASGWWNSSVAMGQLLGPLFGAAVISAFSFQILTISVSLLYVLSLLMTGIIVLSAYVEPRAVVGNMYHQF